MSRTPVLAPTHAAPCFGLALRRVRASRLLVRGLQVGTRGHQARQGTSRGHHGQHRRIRLPLGVDRTVSAGNMKGRGKGSPWNFPQDRPPAEQPEISTEVAGPSTLSTDPIELRAEQKTNISSKNRVPLAQLSDQLKEKGPGISQSLHVNSVSHAPLLQLPSSTAHSDHTAETAGTAPYPDAGPSNGNLSSRRERVSMFSGNRAIENDVFASPNEQTAIAGLTPVQMPPVPAAAPRALRETPVVKQGRKGLRKVRQ